MGIEEELAEIEKQIKEAQKAPETVIEETPPQDELVGEESGQTDDKQADEPQKADDGAEENDEGEAESDEAPAKEAKDYVKERRRSRRELEDALIAAQAKLAAIEALNAQKAQEAQIAANAKQHPENQPPNKDEDPDAYRDWVIEQQSKALNATQAELQKIARANLQTQARAELASIEQEFAKKATDYHEVIADAEARFAKIVRLQNPNATDVEIRAMLDKDKIEAAAVAVRNGQNPAEAMYNRVKALFGYEPPKAKPVQKSEAEKLAAVAKNKSLSASGMTGRTASGNSALSREALANMTPAEYAKLSDAERKLFLTVQ